MCVNVATIAIKQQYRADTVHGMVSCCCSSSSCFIMGLTKFWGSVLLPLPSSSSIEQTQFMGQWVAAAAPSSSVEACFNKMFSFRDCCCCSWRNSYNRWPFPPPPNSPHIWTNKYVNQSVTFIVLQPFYNCMNYDSPRDAQLVLISPDMYCVYVTHSHTCVHAHTCTHTNTQNKHMFAHSQTHTHSRFCESQLLTE